VDAGGTGGTASASAAEVHPLILERMIEQAVEKSRAIGGGRSVGRVALPKRMRQKTYSRICARLDACEAVRDDRLIRVLARLMKRL
jgi:hypothetical protein